MTEAVSGDRSERLIALGGLLGVAALAWVYLWHEAVSMQAMDMTAGGMDTMPMTTTLTWSPAALLLTFLMWAIMMVGMMLPSAVPAILLYGSIVRRKRARGAVLPSVAVFASGYLAVWTVFSAVATLLQATLQDLALVGPMMVSGSAWLSGALLVVAGVYQWLPVKEACLAKCRAPLQFFMFRWRAGHLGAVRMGAEHGAFCVGCCWALMLLLFVAGVMNLVWVALIAVFVLVEKLLPAGRSAGRIVGALLVIAGVAVAATGYDMRNLVG